MQQGIKPHYLDYYSEWLLALKKATGYHDMKAVFIRATAFIGIINELFDAGQMCDKLHAEYKMEVETLTAQKTNIFLN